MCTVIVAVAVDVAVTAVAFTTDFAVGHKGFRDQGVREQKTDFRCRTFLLSFSVDFFLGFCD